MGIQKIMVVGSGLMGSGIAQVCAQAGLDVLLHDVSHEALQKALKSIEWSVGKLVEKGTLSEARATIIGRIETIQDIVSGKSADLVIEAVFEDFELKQEVFRRLDKTCNSETLFASNTSAIPITELAAVTSRPNKFMGLHFFSPVPMMQAVEVVRGTATADDTLSLGMAFVRSIGKEPIRVMRESFRAVVPPPSCSAPLTIERNLHKRNMQLLRPTLSCANRIGPGEVSLMRKIAIIKRGESIRIPANDMIKSNILIKYLTGIIHKLSP